ncbi:8373_t:CDS:1 [Funneliformis mosseae]|uniref:8373_t:CDS:1 n=1 Tax=Funneliformis mosseae TaxID=27381 RepID=A0A9N9D008_FUNMO|nr:8373_t:CDS:1 [Funneliformis mosseae]
MSTEYDTDNNNTSKYSVQEDPSNDNNDFLNIFENYSHPIFNFDTSSTSELPKDELIKGILIWIMKFRLSYNLSNTAIDDLIKYIKIVLKDCKSINHKSFSNSLYILRKSLGLIDQFTQFAAYQKYHKLYKKYKVISEDNNTIRKCSHVKFPNSTTKESKQCQIPLGKKILLNNSISIVSELVYSVLSIQQQIFSIFR